jgi:hypothetical protein
MTTLCRVFLAALKEQGSNAVFLDCGINIGTHSLYMARNGYKTFGVDPLTANLVRVSNFRGFNEQQVVPDSRSFLYFIGHSQIVRRYIHTILMLGHRQLHYAQIWTSSSKIILHC